MFPTQKWIGLALLYRLNFVTKRCFITAETDANENVFYSKSKNTSKNEKPHINKTKDAAHTSSGTK